MKIQYIYALICPEDGEIKYIGKTTDPYQRLQGHIAYARRKSHLKGKHEWIRNLYDKDMKPKMMILEKCDDDTWIAQEKYWIEYHSNKTNLFNKTKGGEDFVFKSGHNPWNKGGGCYSDESRAKMSKSASEKTLTEEHKANTSKTMKGVKKSASHVENIRKGLGKKVLQLDLEGNILNEYPAASFAAEAVGCKRESIRDACKGRIKVCKGYKWRLKEEQL